MATAIWIRSTCKLPGGTGRAANMAPKSQLYLAILTGETLPRTGESDTPAGEVAEWPGTPVCFIDMRSTALPASSHPSGVIPELAM